MTRMVDFLVPGRETRAAALTAVLLLGSQVGLRLSSVETVRRVLKWSTQRATGTGALSPSLAESEIRRAIGRVNGGLPGHRDCLTQALVAEALLSATGHSAQIHLGVTRNGENITAHSWVEGDEDIVVGDAVDLDQFSRLGQLETE
jgi:hypothetical protein